MEHSAGIVLFRERKGRQYLLLKSSGKNGFWSFAKGRIEKNETKREAALREVQEEAGLQNIKLIPKFKEKTNYYKQKEGKTIYKEVIWFLGKASDKSDGKVSWEHEELKWFNFRNAMKKLKFDNDKRLLRKAEKFWIKQFISKSHIQSI